MQQEEQVWRNDYDFNFGHTEGKGPVGQPGKKNGHEVEYLEFGSLRTPRDEVSFLVVRTGRGTESSFLDGGRQIEQGRC